VVALKEFDLQLLQAGQHRNMFRHVLGQIRVPVLGHVGFLGAEVPGRGLQEPLQEAADGPPVRPILDRTPQLVHGREELLVLLVDELDPRVVPRIPDCIHARDPF
jgi:hypothetical protein